MHHLWFLHRIHPICSWYLNGFKYEIPIVEYVSCLDCGSLTSLNWMDFHVVKPYDTHPWQNVWKQSKSVWMFHILLDYETDGVNMSSSSLQTSSLCLYLRHAMVFEVFIVQYMHTFIQTVEFTIMHVYIPLSCLVDLENVHCLHGGGFF